MSQISEDKVGIVESTVSLLKKYEVVAAANLFKVQSGVLMDLRRSLRGQLEVKAVKNLSDLVRMLTFFFRYMPQLIDGDHLFIAQPPLFRLAYKNQVRYAYADKDKDKLVKELGGAEKVGISRYKGLGEMNPEQLWETTMNPANRTLLQVSVEDAAEADRTFDMLMGDAVDPRKRFIQTHARYVRNLDV